MLWSAPLSQFIGMATFNKLWSIIAKKEYITFLFLCTWAMPCSINIFTCTYTLKKYIFLFIDRYQNPGKNVQQDQRIQPYLIESWQIRVGGWKFRYPTIIKQWESSVVSSISLQISTAEHNYEINPFITISRPTLKAIKLHPPRCSVTLPLTFKSFSLFKISSEIFCFKGRGNSATSSPLESPSLSSFTYRP